MFNLLSVVVRQHLLFDKLSKLAVPHHNDLTIGLPEFTNSLDLLIDRLKLYYPF